MAALGSAGVTIPGLLTGVAARETHTHSSIAQAAGESSAGVMLARAAGEAGTGFVPARLASWWCTIEDLQWPQKQIVDKIRRRADGFAKAKIDTAINFGFHNRFDFANYFHQLHGYYADVCDVLHQRGIRFMDHYSCNDITRPRTEADFRFLHKYERHAVLLFPDPVAARLAQYEGHLYDDLCEVDLRDGSRGYATQYQFEAFCHNNPNFLDMHMKYLQRLMREVPFDAIEIDDMCSYPGNTTCGCRFCRDRFRKDYGHEIPPFSDSSFFGDTSREMLQWGNYANPVYRDWLRMKADIVFDHVKLIKTVIGDKPLMTCCSNTGPISLNAVALNLEKMAPALDLFMLENVGTNIKNVAWMDMEAEALHQKDIARKRNNAPAMALSYSIFEKGAYFGWALARYWGVANWSSTLNTRIEEDPRTAQEDEDAIGRSNNWEIKYSDLAYRDGEDVVEMRLVNNSLCKENGWRDEKGNEHWDRSMAWTMAFIRNSVGYRFVRAAELEDTAALSAENTPLIMDGVACVSDRQYEAIQHYLAAGGRLFLSLPFGTHDQKGFVRPRPLSDQLLKTYHRHIVVIDSALYGKPLEGLIAKKIFRPMIVQTGGDTRWTVRARKYGDKTVLHFMNTALTAVPDEAKDFRGVPLMKDILSDIHDNMLRYIIEGSALNVDGLAVMSPELNGTQRKMTVSKISEGKWSVAANLTGVSIYAVAQPVAG